jgi:hypothetical protein
MEKIKKEVQEDAFLKKYVQEIELDYPKEGFSVAIMDAILAQKKQTILNSTPLISKKIWMLTLGFIATCLWFLFQDKKTSTFEFPMLELRFLNKIQMPNLFENVSISSTILYSTIVFSVLAFVQLFYLKNHFNKRFES